MSYLNLERGPLRLSWRMVFLLASAGIIVSYVSSLILLGARESWGLFSDIYSFYELNETLLGPPNIAYGFGRPMFSGALFFLTSALSNVTPHHWAAIFILPLYALAIFSTSLLRGEKFSWSALWFLAPSSLIFALGSWEIVPTSLVLLSAYLLSVGRLGSSAFTLALACSSSFYPLLLIPLFVLGAVGDTRLRFFNYFLLAFLFLNFPFFIMNSHRWVGSYVDNVVGTTINGSIWHLLFGGRVEGFFLSLITFLMFAFGYLYVVLRSKEKPLLRLVPEVLTFFLLSNGVYLLDTNLWILPFLGVMRLNPLIFFSFDLISSFIPLISTFSPIMPGSLTNSLIREALLLILFLYVWRLKPRQIKVVENPLKDIFDRGKAFFDTLGRNLRVFIPKLYPVFLSLVAAAIIFIRLNEPEKICFDEEYYVGASRSILQGLGDPNWVHPPFAKILISLGILLLGDNPWGWRLPGALLGVLCVPLLYFIGVRLYGSRKIGLLAGLLLAFDFLFFVQSRIAMLDIFVLSFSLMGVYFLLTSNLDKRGYLILSGVFLGLAAASKLSGVFIILTCLFYSLFKVRGTDKYRLLWIFLALLLTPILTYCASQTPIFLASWSGPADFLNYQLQILGYSAQMEGTHPYMSEPWTWPFMLRPLLMLYDSQFVNGVEYIATISALGNPVTWYIGLVVIVSATFDVFIRKMKANAFAVLWFLMSWLPYFSIGIAHTFFSGGRPQFIFYFLQSVPPLILALASHLEEADRGIDFPVSALFILSAVVGFVLTYPIISAYPVPLEYVRGMKILRLEI
ncbi:MAG: glycosyltransferase family 39 protein [Candidatus Geothermarchaeales archaeon]